MAQTQRQVPLSELERSERYTRLRPGSKDLVVTITLVAYRSETAMAPVMREALPEGRREEARRLLQSRYTMEGDLEPDPAAGTRVGRLHSPANPLPAHALEHLCAQLSSTETVFPTTALKLVFNDRIGGRFA